MKARSESTVRQRESRWQPIDVVSVKVYNSSTLTLRSVGWV